MPFWLVVSRLINLASYNKACGFLERRPIISSYNSPYSGVAKLVKQRPLCILMS